MKLLTCFLVLMGICLVACVKRSTAPGQSTQMMQQVSSSHAKRGRGVPTREEVTTILGAPVTSMEGAATDMEYKTDTMGLDTSMQVELQQDSGQAMAGARKAIAMH